MLSRVHTLASRADLQKQRLLDSTGPAATRVVARAHHKCLLAKWGLVSISAAQLQCSVTIFSCTVGSQRLWAAAFHLNPMCNTSQQGPSNAWQQESLLSLLLRHGAAQALGCDQNHELNKNNSLWYHAAHTQNHVLWYAIILFRVCVPQLS